MAVAGGGIDVHGVAADHKILVDHGIVDAQLAAFFQAFVLEVYDRVGKAHTNGQVASCVFVEQRIVEQQAAFADGAALGHQCTLT